MNCSIWAKSVALALVAAVLVPMAAFSQATPATVTCMDGTTSTATGSGACSSHGGVNKAAATTTKSTTPSNAANTSGTSGASSKSSTTASTASSSSPKSYDDTNPNGAFAKCKDGTYWHNSTRSGTCSGHGGVGTWLQTKPNNPAGASKSQLQN
jgi:Protein of unknown function (DUF3761)